VLCNQRFFFGTPQCKTRRFDRVFVCGLHEAELQGSGEAARAALMVSAPKWTFPRCCLTQRRWMGTVQGGRDHRPLVAA
jgi:hypothetical protein